MPIVKSLYVAKNLEELNKKVDTQSMQNHTNPKLLANTAQKLFDEARKCEDLERDEEKAYLLYMRYLDTVIKVKKQSKNAASDKEFYDKLIGKDNINLAQNHVESLSKSLKNRYDLINMTEKLDSESKEKEKEDAKSQLIMGFGKNKKKGSMFPPMNECRVIKSVIEEAKDEKEGGDMTVLRLKNLIEQKATTILVLDCRAASDFSRAHINHPDCVSIPCEILTPGLTANKLKEHLKSLCPASYHAWNKRHEFDRIILYDWNSSYAHPADSISNLLDAITKWDPHTPYKCKPFVLQGGIKQAYYTIPTFILNPEVVKAGDRPDASKSSSAKEINLDSVQYPDFDDDKPQLNNRLSKSNEMNSIINSGNVPTSAVVSSASVIPVNRSTKPTLKPKSANESSTQPLANGFDSNNSNDKPVYDRLPERTPISNLQDVNPPSSVRSSSVLSIDKEAENEYTIETKNILPGKVADLVNGYDKLSIHSNNDSAGHTIGKSTQVINEKNNNNNNHVINSATNVNGVVSNGENSTISHDGQLKLIKNNSNSDSSGVTSSILKNNSTGPVRPDSSTKPSRNTFGIVNGGAGLQRPFSQETSTFSTMKLRDENHETTTRPLKRSLSNPNLAKLSLDDLGESENNIPAFNRNLKPSGLTKSFVGDVHATRRRDFQVVRSTEKAKTGLKNLGNTCYMNSIMQCVNHTAALVAYFQDGDYRQDLNSRGTTKGEFTREFATAINEMNMGHRAIALSDLKAVLSKFYKPFRNYDQQDSHEFLTYLLDWMHEDLNQAAKKPLKEQKNDSMEDHVAADVAWDDYIASNNSQIVKLFCGQQKSSVRCVNCSKTSITFDTFFILSIPIPICPTGKKYTVQQCIDLYTSEEEIGDWGCSNCRVKTRAIKKIDLWRLPPYLIIHFQRFYQNWNENWWRKRLTDIEFPVDLLDLNGKALQRKYENRIDYSYELYGVSNHYGTIEGGHYTAYCRKDRSWAKFDDQEVLSIKPQNVSTSAGYILFYSLKSMERLY